MVCPKLPLVKGVLLYISRVSSYTKTLDPLNCLSEPPPPPPIIDLFKVIPLIVLIVLQRHYVRSDVCCMRYRLVRMNARKWIENILSKTKIETI